MTEPDPLDEFFEAARNAPAHPSDDLMARVAADAAREAPRPAQPARVRPGIFETLGGWPALGGLVTATVAGVWIGVANPLGVDPLDYVGAGGFAVADLSTGYADLEWGAE